MGIGGNGLGLPTCVQLLVIRHHISSLESRTEASASSERVFWFPARKQVKTATRWQEMVLLSLPLSLTHGRMFVCGGTGAGLKYLDSAEVLDDQSGETGLKCAPRCDVEIQENGRKLEFL